MNKEEIKKYRKTYYEANKDKIAKQQKAYCETNKDKIAKKMRAYYEANKDKIAKQQKVCYDAEQKYKKEHPEEYLNVLGKQVYTNGMTKVLKKQLPKLIDRKIKEMLK